MSEQPQAAAMEMSRQPPATAMPGQPSDPEIAMVMPEEPTAPAMAQLAQGDVEMEQFKQLSSYIDQRHKNLLHEGELDDDEGFQERPRSVHCFCDLCRRYECLMKKNLPTNRLKLEEDKTVVEVKKQKLEDRKNTIEAKEKQFLEEWKAEEHFNGILHNEIAVYMRRFEEFDQTNNPDVPPIEGCPNSEGKGNDLIG